MGSYTDTPQSWKEKNRRSSLGAARANTSRAKVHCFQARETIFCIADERLSTYLFLGGK